jgi:hypothetical protein
MELFDRSVTVFHDDQDIGPFPDGLTGCFNIDHGHPVPCGPWSTEVTIQSFRAIRKEAERRNIENFFLTKEYCSEVLIQDFDLHLSRGGSQLTNKTGKIPLSEYLYHEYIPVGLNHASVVSSGGVINSIISGKIPGIGGPDSISGVPGWGTLTFPEEASIEVLTLLDDYYSAMKIYAKDFLLYGKWVHSLLHDDSGCRTSTWMDDSGNLGVFAINPHAEEKTLQIPVPVGGNWHVDYYTGSLLQQSILTNQDDTISWNAAPGRLTAVLFSPYN